MPSETFIDGPERPQEFGESDWQRWLGQQSWVVGGQEKGGILLGKLNDGVRDSYAQLECAFTYPRILFDREDVPNKARYLWPANVITVSPYKLVQACRHSFEAILRLRTPEGVTLFEGYIPDDYYLIGLEEGHHAYLHHAHPDKEFSSSLDIDDVVHHDALVQEFAALQFVRSVAEARNLPEVTRLVLDQRIRAAKALRGEM